MPKKNGKKITVDQLAVIINNGFNGQMEYMKEEFGKISGRFEGVDKKFEGIDKRFDGLEKYVEYIKENLKSAVELEKDVEYIKNTMGIPELKK